MLFAHCWGTKEQKSFLRHHKPRRKRNTGRNTPDTTSTSTTPTTTMRIAGAKTHRTFLAGLGAVYAVVATLLVSRSGAREMLLNDVQVKGSHFSFHQAPSPSIPYFNYSHTDLRSQLENQQVHAIELKFGFESQNQDFPVYATRGIDGVSSCPNVSFCLQEVRQYTVAHSNHFPIFVILEATSDAQIPTAKWFWDWFDTALTSAWPEYDIVKPSDVMGSFSTAKASVKARGWPSLQSSMGKVVFLLRVNQTAYSDGTNNLQDRVGFPIFPLGTNTSGDAVVFESTHPLYHVKDIQDAVQQNSLVITRTDATFTPEDVDAFDTDTYFALLDADGDGQTTTAEMEHLFGEGMKDFTDDQTSSTETIISTLNTAVFECAGAYADTVNREQFGCVMNDLKGVLPAPESLLTVQARTASAKKSGAHILLTDYPAAPFKGAPASTYWWLSFDTACNPVTTCGCDMDDFLALDTCGNPASWPRASPLAVTAVFLLAFNKLFL